MEASMPRLPLNDARGRASKFVVGMDDEGQPRWLEEYSDGTAAPIQLRNLTTAQLLELIQFCSPSPATQEALDLAFYCHLGVQRKQLVRGRHRPYIDHPMRIALRAYLWAAPFCPQPVVDRLIHAALLHDVIEDSPERVLAFYQGGNTPSAARAALRNPIDAPHKGHPTTGEELRRLTRRALVLQNAALEVIAAHFGHRVAQAIKHVTNPLDAEMSVMNDPAAKREAYLAHLKTTLSHDPLALVIKAGDLWDNGSSVVYLGPANTRKGIAKYTPAIAHIQHLARTPGYFEKIGCPDIVGLRLALTLDQLNDKFQHHLQLINQE